MSYSRTMGMIIVECDACGVKFESDQFDLRDAMHALRNIEWTIRYTSMGPLDFCPKCSERGR